MFFNPVDFKRQKVGVNIFKDDIAQSPKVDVITEPVITEPIITEPIIEPIITEQLVEQVTEAIVELSIVDEPKTISIMDIDVKEENL
jgi:hypothetical protein